EVDGRLRTDNGGKAHADSGGGACSGAAQKAAARSHRLDGVSVRFRTAFHRCLLAWYSYKSLVATRYKLSTAVAFIGYPPTRVNKMSATFFRALVAAETHFRTPDRQHSCGSRKKAATSAAFCSDPRA